MGRYGTLIRGITKPTYSSSINRKKSIYYMAPSSPQISLESVSAILMLTMERQSRQPRMPRATSTRLYLYSLTHLRILLVNLFIFRESPMACVIRFAQHSYTELYPQGRYLPAFASYIYDQNQVAKVAGKPTINLKSVLIGNGITDVST